MTKEICYEFDDYLLDPLRRTLLLRNEPRPLTPKAFDLLIVFVDKRGEILSKGELIRSVWSEAVVTDNNFNVTLTALRNALGETAREPRYIIKVPDGYRFVADVRKVFEVDPQQVPDESAREDERETDSRNDDSIRPSELSARAPSSHVVHILVSSTLYAALYATCIVLEVAYGFERFKLTALKITPLAFVWIAFSSLAALTLDRKLVAQGSARGLAVSLGTFLLAAVLLFGGLTRFLPSIPITQANFQTYPALAAYFKDMVYFAALAFLYLILPFHRVLRMEVEIRKGRYRSVLDICTAELSAPLGASYPGFWVLALLLVIIALAALAMTAHLLDNLKPSPYSNLFTLLVYLRGVLYFGMGVECLIWYHSALGDLRRDCKLMIRAS
jgi:DNA-binding winged helix-turn-helix (wHTH) protein